MTKNKSVKSVYRGGRPSPFKIWEFAYEIHDLLDIPLDVCYSKAGNKYLKPYTGVKIIRAVINSMKAALHRGEEIRIDGFGKFWVDMRSTSTYPYIACSKDGTGIKSAILQKTTKKHVYFKPSDVLVTLVHLDSPESLTYDHRRLLEGWRRHENRTS